LKWRCDLTVSQAAESGLSKGGREGEFRGTGFCEDVLQEIGDSGGRIRPDFPFLLSLHDEEAIEASPHHVVISVDQVILGKRNRFEMTDQFLVLIGHADVVHRVLRFRTECGDQFVSGCAFEVVGGRGMASVQDLFRIGDCHLSNSPAACALTSATALR